MGDLKGLCVRNVAWPPRAGEEAFVVSVSPEPTVRFEIRAFSRPGDPLVRLSGPIG